MRVILCLLTALVVVTPASGELQAGAAVADVTPLEWPVRIVGGFTPIFADRGHDPLMARAIVLANNGKKLAIAVVDSCYIKRWVLDQAKRQAQETTGIPSDHMLIAATHTHSAPPSSPLHPTEPEARYQRYLEKQIASAIIQANDRLQPAEIGWAVRDVPEELFNRRWFKKPGTIPPNPFGETTDQVQMNPGSADLVRPAGPTDPQFWVVSVRSRSAKPLTLLGNYSLHYVGGVPSDEVSADYFGEFARIMAQRQAPGRGDPPFVAILSNGTSGDVNNINFRQPRGKKAPYERIREVATRMANEAEGALQKITYRRDVVLEAAQRELPLQYRKPTAEQLAQARAVLAEPDESKLPRRAKAYAERVVRLHEGPDYADALLQTLRIGDLGIAAVPFEVFTETGLEVKSKSPLQPVFTMELANGHYGYLPTPEQHKLGGYETWMGTNLVEIGASIKITGTILDLFRSLR